MQSYMGLYRALPRAKQGYSRAIQITYKQKLINCYLESDIFVESEKETYRFGNGGTLVSVERVTCPLVVANNPLKISFSVVRRHCHCLSGVIS